MTDHTSRATGALPPPDFAWQIGKNAASITFVKEAEDYLLTSVGARFSFDIEPGDEDLRAYVAQVKSGIIVLNKGLTVEEFFAHY